MARKVFITTYDNPYDPETQFDLWYAFDKEKGYDSCDYLARIARTADALSDEENTDEIEWAIDEIIANDFTDTYKKIVRDIDLGEDD